MQLESVVKSSIPAMNPWSTSVKKEHLVTLATEVVNNISYFIIIWMTLINSSTTESCDEAQALLCWR